MDYKDTKVCLADNCRWLYHASWTKCPRCGETRAVNLYEIMVLSSVQHLFKLAERRKQNEKS
jgi:hypothetical protein